MTGRYELLEHTADVGIRARGSSPEEVFEAVGRAVADLLGAWSAGSGEPSPVEVQGSDREALLVAWVDELLYLFETGSIVFGGFEVAEAGERSLRAEVRLAPIDADELDGQHVKAATYHRLRMAREDAGWVAEIYLDV